MTDAVPSIPQGWTPDGVARPRAQRPGGRRAPAPHGRPRLGVVEEAVRQRGDDLRGGLPPGRRPLVPRRFERRASLGPGCLRGHGARPAARPAASGDPEPLADVEQSGGRPDHTASSPRRPDPGPSRRSPRSTAAPSGTTPTCGSPGSRRSWTRGSRSSRSTTGAPPAAGKAFREELKGNIGFPETEDIVAGIDHVVAEGLADPQALFLEGWSWGGYLTTLIAGLHPDRWRAACAGIPVGDYVAAHYESAPTLRAWDIATMGGSPMELPELYRERNPMTYVDRVAGADAADRGRARQPMPARAGDGLRARAPRARTRGRRAPVRAAGTTRCEVEEKIDHARRSIDFFRRPSPGTESRSYSSAGALSDISRICSTISAFASVVTSPSASSVGHVAEQPAHDLARAGLREVGGEDDPVRTRDLADLRRDVLAQLRRHRRRRLRSRIFRVTNATIASPTRSSGLETTAASATLSSSTSADSISKVESRWPATFITSSIRPRSQKYPSSSRLAPSPATYTSGPYFEK